MTGPHLPYLLFPTVGALGRDACLALVDEGSGERTPLVQDSRRYQRRPVLVKAPIGPYHLEAALAAGVLRPLVFQEPLEMGRLSALAGACLDSHASLLFAGLGIWLTAIYWRRLGLAALGTPALARGLAKPSLGMPIQTADAP